MIMGNLRSLTNVASFSLNPSISIFKSLCLLKFPKINHGLIAATPTTFSNTLATTHYF